MIDIEINVQLLDGEEADPWLDSYERDMMLQHTVAHLEAHIQRSLGELECEEHHQPPRVHVTILYSQETEQFEDLKYDVQTCCKPFLLKAVAALNRK